MGALEERQGVRAGCLHNCYVLIVPGSGFCPVYGKDHFRMDFLPPVETLERAFDSIGSYMRKVA